MAFRKNRDAGPATKELRRHVRASGPITTWTPEQRAEHNRLSNAAMREQAGASEEQTSELER